MSVAVASMITEQHKQQYKNEGYFILEKVISDEHLALCRSECDALVEREIRSKDLEKFERKHERYFIADCYKQRNDLGQFVFGELMADVCRATIGPEAYLFYDQFVVKGAEVGLKFGWHQDSGYVGHPHTPYLTCWCPLDDVYVANGTVYVLPYSRAGTRDVQPHVYDASTNDKIGYHGSDPGDPVIVPAGSIAVFSSTTFHRSGTNTTDKRRRVYVVQYSPDIILDKEGKGPSSQAVPFLKAGKRVSQR
jgi:ectoine hydroxylase-related dioxygenase (phytanoyl-CoA dioxygenase family)